MAQGAPVTYEVLVIGGSAGSLDAILQLLPAIQPSKSLAIILIIHRRSGESVLTNLLKHKTDWIVKEAEEKETIRAGTIYIAPADYHLLIEKNKTFSLDFSERVHFSRPAIDVTFEAAADVYGRSVIAILLSGANHDGTDGLKKIKEAGGYVIVQNPADAEVAYMPQFALEAGVADAVVDVADLAATIGKLVTAM